MQSAFLFGTFALSLAAGFLAVPFVRQAARRLAWIDVPDGGRKAHDRPVPNVGGVALVVAFVIGVDGAPLLAPLFGAGDFVARLMPPPLVVIGACFIAAIGLLDDLLELGYRTKFACQALVTALVMLSGSRVMLFDPVFGTGWAGLAVSGLLTLVWVVGMMNAMNLIDGRDGLAGGVALIALLGMAGAHALNGDTGGLVGVAALAGALVAFLRFNFHPASIFMGDSGSLFLGYLLAAYGLRGTAHSNDVIALIVPVVAVGLPVLDTLLSIARRFVLGRPVFFPDRDHIHHRVSALFRYRQAVVVLWGLEAFFAAGAMAMAASGQRQAAIIFLAGLSMVLFVVHRLGYFRRSAATGEVQRSSEVAIDEAAVSAEDPAYSTTAG
jgi:UDP-GlcNAc:undecaprenyl-phosphate GlcNAc-1-phosphate transferase